MFRDSIAAAVCRICVADTSKQMSEGRMPLQDAERATDFIAVFSYLMADKMLKARGRR